MDKEIKKIDIAELRELGVIHELNRLFLHPLGLALEVSIDKDGKESLGEIWDCREDPEGVVFGTIDREKIERTMIFMKEQHRRRKEVLGFIIQTQDEAD